MSDLTIKVESSPHNWTFAWDWACTTCGCYGYIKVVTTGGQPKPGGGMYPKTSDEDVQKLRWDAHFIASEGKCSSKRFLRPTVGGGAPVLWRREFKDGAWRMIVMPETLREYRWPPARPPWVAR